VEDEQVHVVEGHAVLVERFHHRFRHLLDRVYEYGPTVHLREMLAAVEDFMGDAGPVVGLGRRLGP